MKKRLLSLALSLALSLSLMPMGAAAAGRSFVDVKKSDWFYEGVQYTVDKGLFKGISADKFGPEEEMTRAMVVQTLYALCGKPRVKVTDRFSDVKKGDWFAEAVSWAVKMGVASGYDATHFGPEDTITREQLAVMLHGYRNKPGSKYPLYFQDSASVSGWAKPAVRWAVENKLMSGVGNNRLAPQNTATRAEGAVIMTAFDKLVHEHGVDPGPNGENQLPIG